MKPSLHLLILSTNILASLTQDAEVQELSTFNTNFTCTLYQQVKKTENGNIWVSPFSAKIIMALLLSGSRGQSADEIRSFFHSSNATTVTLEESVKTLLQDLESTDQYKFHLVNKIYVDEKHRVNEDFKKKALDFYFAHLESIDFGNIEESVASINNWVKNQTHGIIQKVLEVDSMDNNTKLVLVNALYFKASWSQPFYASLTKKITFYTRVDAVMVEAMQNRYGQLFLFRESRRFGCKFLELPFKGGASMTIILPNQRDGLLHLENQIHKLLLLQNLTWERVEVAIPKFKFENNVDLMRIFKDRGVITIFDDLQADISGIGGEKGQLVVNRLVQKSFIEINEEGVQAAAATSVSVHQPKSVHMEPPKEFVADHPFIFYIRVGGIIVFVGRVMDPN